MEQEEACNKLKGIKMGDDVDVYITELELLMWKAGYDLRDDIVLKVFTNVLPAGLYDKIYNINDPWNYKVQQQVILHYLHMKPTERF